MPDPASSSSEDSAQHDPGPSNRVFYPALDGLRAVAFLMVFGQHYLRLSWGWTGVDIFFVLSGFLITGILFDTKNQPHRVWNFYIRRTLRIFPLYYGIFLLLLLVAPIFHWHWDLRWSLWPLHLGNFARFVQPYTLGSSLQRLADAQTFSATYPAVSLLMGHFWSLCVEEQFYLFWPWVVFFVKERRHLFYICLASVVMTPAVRLTLSPHLPGFMREGEVLYRVIFFRTDALLLGGLLALAIRGGHYRLLLRVARIVALACVLATAAWVAVTPQAQSFFLDWYPPWIFTWGLSFIDLFAASILVMALETTSWIYRTLNVRPLCWLGRISYGAYVLHDIPHHLYSDLCAKLHTPTPNRVAAIALPCTLLMAWISFRYFESPFIRLKEKLSR